MGGRGQMRLLLCACALSLAACGPGDEGVDAEAAGGSESQGAPPASGEQPLPGGGLQVAPANPEEVNVARPVAPLFQPGFNEALRWSYSASAVTTFRLKIPVARAGSRVRLAFRSGDGSMTLTRVTVAKAGANGALASTPVAVTFSGAPGFTVANRVRVVSDPVPFTVGFRDELAVSFEAKGALAVSAIETLPGSFTRAGNYATVTGALGGTAWAKGVGLSTVDVEGPPARAFVAIGDSITEGYITDHDDTRLAWPALTEAKLGVPVANAGVSGQGFYDELINLDQEVLSLQGYTDCLILLGTNDLTLAGHRRAQDAHEHARHPAPATLPHVGEHAPAQGEDEPRRLRGGQARPARLQRLGAHHVCEEPHRPRGGDAPAGQRAPVHRRAGGGRHPPEHQGPPGHGRRGGARAARRGRPPRGRREAPGRHPRFRGAIHLRALSPGRGAGAVRGSLAPMIKNRLFATTAAALALSLGACGKTDPQPTPIVEDPQAGLEGDRIETSEGNLLVHPINHATFYLNWGGKTLYFDPVGERARFEGQPAPDVIFVTDVHGDHLSADTLKALVKRETVIVAPKAVKDLLPAELQAVTQELANGASLTVAGVPVEALPMYNLTAERLSYHTKGRGNGYVLTVGDKRVYVAGDTEDIPEMRALKDITVAFVPMNLPFTMTVEQAASAVREFKPRYVYPYHSRGSDVEKFSQLVGTDVGVEVRLRTWY